jgi:hypothetical protein
MTEPKPGGFVPGPGNNPFATIAETLLGPDRVKAIRQQARERVEADLKQARWDLRWHYASVLLKVVWVVIGLSTAIGFDIVVWRAVFS